MLLQSTDTVALEAAFLDELSKIAEAREGGDGQSHPWITKERLKRLAIVAPVAALGYGSGYLSSKAIQRAIHPERAARALERSGLHKYLPHAIGAVGAVGSAALAMKSQKVREYIEAGDKKDKRK